jgi:hypothetical protein
VEADLRKTAEDVVEKARRLCIANAVIDRSNSLTLADSADFRTGFLWLNGHLIIGIIDAFGCRCTR